MRAAFLAVALAVVAVGDPQAAVLRVGPGQAYAQPSAAIAAAMPGDTVLIAPGSYFDCAVIAHDRVTVAGDGPGVELTDKTCEGKAILVARGRDIVVKDLTLTRARVPDRNGAGIRAEGEDLTVLRTRFVDNEDGILAGENSQSTIRIMDSEFVRNGRCIGACAHAIYAGRIALLRVERSRFTETREGHHIKSRAATTQLIDDRIEDGPEGTASFLVELPDGGALTMQGCTLEKGPRTENARAAVMIGAESAGPADARRVVTDNRFTDDSGRQSAFVIDWAAGETALANNTLPPGTVGLSSAGWLRHRATNAFNEMRDEAAYAYGLAKRVVAKVIGR